MRINCGNFGRQAKIVLLGGIGFSLGSGIGSGLDVGFLSLGIFTTVARAEEASAPQAATPPTEATQPAEAAAPIEATQPAEVTPPVEATQPAEPTPPVEATQPTAATPTNAGGAADTAAKPGEPAIDSAAPAPALTPLPAAEMAQPTPAAERAAPAAAAPAAEEHGVVADRPYLRSSRVAKNEHLFGSYRIRIGIGKPNFNDGLKYYDKLYGSTKIYPTIAADWFAWDWFATMGLGLRMGYYTASGYTSHTVEGKEAGDYTSSDVGKNYGDSTSLTLLPLQLVATAEFTPFQRKWVVLDGWIGYERLYFQETRNGASSTATTANAGTASSMRGIHLATDTSSSSGATTTVAKDDTLTNSGWKNSTVVGGAVNFLLNPLDGPSARSLQGIGLGYVYFSPYIEIVRSVTKGLSFGRTTYGAAFTFETLR